MGNNQHKIKHSYHKDMQYTWRIISNLWNANRPRHAAQYKSYLNKCSPTSCKEKKTEHHTQASHYNSVKNCHYNSVKISITEHTQHSNIVQHSNSHNL